MPNLTVLGNVPVSIWGQRHLRYIQVFHRALYTSLRLSGKLSNYLADINQQAEVMFSKLVEQMVQAQDITEALKAKDWMIWAGQMNNVRAVATEIVNVEIF